jgi:hypothetical protein
VTRAWAIVIFLLLACTACTDTNNTEEPNRNCSLFPIDRKADPSVVPEPFLLDGMQVAKSIQTKKRLTVAMNNPRSVQESFPLYKQAVKEAGFELVGEDNEGFEAELYIRRGSTLGQIQIRMSPCPDATGVYLILVRT